MPFRARDPEAEQIAKYQKLLKLGQAPETLTIRMQAEGVPENIMAAVLGKELPPKEDIVDVASNDPSIWHVTNSSDTTKPPSITFYESTGNGFHLSAIVRKYTGARVIIKGGGRQQQVVVPLAQLYDALGLLRSLQYDVKEFNAAVLQTSIAKNERRYATFRLSRQAAAFGVRLSTALNEANGGTVQVPCLDNLVEYIEAQHQEQIQVAQTNIASGLVEFTSLSEYFQPGRDVVDAGGLATGFACPTLLRVRASYYSRGKSLFGPVCNFHVALEFCIGTGDGKFAVVEAALPQSEFQGTRSIVNSIDMLTLPTEEVLHELEERGMRYQAICGGTAGSDATSAFEAAATGSGVLVEYAAGTFLPISPPNSSGNRQGTYSRASRSGGRMVVDTTLAWTRGVHCAKASQGLAVDAVVNTLKLYAQKRQQSLAAATRSGSSEYTTAGVASSDGETAEMLILEGSLPDCLLARTWPAVAGFSLQARSWGCALVHGLSNVHFFEGAFDALVLPASRKKLIRALVTHHGDNANSSTADVMAGKGEGSIFLLHGPPGVGKTLTAEAIAEMLHKPLYVVSMGELGTTPEALEDRLQDILDLCVPWNALVLIDEAEMLLERRSKNDIIRNAMVCVMLRLLEYYSGILFLTTNRVESLDPAFQSRVTCALRYEPLSLKSRCEIWRNTLKRVGVAEERLADEEEDKGDMINVTELAGYDINGRQIKNAVQLALALARHESADLSQAHLLQTLEITSSFLADSSAAAAADGDGTVVF